MTPIAKPLITAPPMEPMPPMTTTANTKASRLLPMVGLIWRMGAAMTPENAARAAPKP